MINKAIAKITNEMMQENDPLVQMIEEHLTKICTNEDIATKLLIEGKTLKEVKDKLYAKAKIKAEKNRNGNAGGAHISDEECFAFAEDYYGITEEDKQETKKPVKADVIDITQFL